MTSPFEILCYECNKMIWEDGVEIDLEATYFTVEFVSGPLITGFCEDCYYRPNGYGVVSHRGGGLVATKFKQISKDEVKIWEIMKT